jgi:hypothetical protein
MTNPYLTYAAAVADCRASTGDWVLFRRGDTFTLTASITERSGASDTDLALVTAYGSSGAMPIVRPPTATTVPVSLYTTTGFQRYAITRLDFYSSTRDPGSGDYTGTSGNRGLYIFGDGASGDIRQLVIEGCKFRFFASNEIQAVNNATLGDIAIRRNLILDNYSANGHSHGLYAYAIDGFLFEGNILDHNGWYSKGGVGQPSIFHHGSYFYDMHNVTYKGNIITRSSSIGTKLEATDAAYSTYLTIEDNLWIDGEIALTLGDNEDSPAFTFNNVDIKDNIATNLDRDNPTERGLGWGFTIHQLDTGTISGNILMNWENPAVINTLGMRFSTRLKDVDVENNINYNMNSHGNSDETYILRLEDLVSASNNTVTNNYFQEATEDLGMVYVEDSADVSAFSFVGNEYYASSEEFLINVTSYNFSGWVGQTGDTGSFVVHTFPDPTRDIETYMSYLGETATIIAFINKCRAQNRFEWDSDFTASSVNSWIRAGFIDPTDAARHVIMFA